MPEAEITMNTTAALSVYSGLKSVGGKQVRTLVAAKNQKQASELLDVSLNELRSYWAKTGNAHELEIARAAPGVVFSETEPRSRVFKPRR